MINETLRRFRMERFVHRILLNWISLLHRTRCLICLSGLSLVFLQNAAVIADGDAVAVDQQQVAEENPFPQAVNVPDGILDGGSEWLNTSEPISMRDLRGKIVLLDFWTYCCINCMHVLPDLKFLEEKYDRQLVVIGVHSAKFDNEKLTQNIREAILRHEIRHPVVNDSEMLIWRKFGTRAWPTLALVDPEGKYIGSQSGEGHRELFDQVIGKLVDYHRRKGTLDESPIVFSLESGKSAPTPLRFPGKVLADPDSQRLFVSDTGHNRIVISGVNGELLDIVGSGRVGRRDGSFEEAEFDHPQGMALVDQVLYVADMENHLLRAVDLTNRTVTTLAGTGSQGRPGLSSDGTLRNTALNSPWSVVHAKGTLYIAMAGPHQIWSHQLASNQISVYAGSGREDVINGELSSAAFAQPSELTVDSAQEFLYAVDSEGSAIRRIPVGGSGIVSTIAGTSELPRGQSLFAFGDVDGIGDQARFQHPLGIAFDAGVLFVADSYNHKIKRVDLADRSSTSWLGTGQAGTELLPAQFSEPGGLSVSAGKLYIADTNNHRVCIADIQTGAVTDLQIEALKPPSPGRTRVPPSADDAIVLPRQILRSGSELLMVVDLAIPDGYKRNELTPVVWELYADGLQSIISDEVLSERREAAVEGSSAIARVPLLTTTGEASLLLQMSYGYCRDDSSLCRLATAVWRIPLELSDSEEAGDNEKPETISVRFPNH